MPGIMKKSVFVTVAVCTFLIAQCRSDNKEHNTPLGCDSRDQAQCEELRSAINESRVARELAFESNHIDEAVSYTLEYNRSLELLEQLRMGSAYGESQAEINRRYDRYQELLNPEEELVSASEIAKISCESQDKQCKTLLNEIKDLSALRIQDLAKAKDSMALAATNLELVYRINLLNARAAGNASAEETANKDYRSLWGILRQINF